MYIFTFGAGFAAVSRQQNRLLTVGFGTVLLDVLAADFPEHLSTPTPLLLTHTSHTQSEQIHSSQVISSINTMEVVM